MKKIILGPLLGYAMAASMLCGPLVLASGCAHRSQQVSVIDPCCGPETNGI